MTVTGVKATAGIFATYPAPYLSLLGGFIDQVAVKPSRVGSGHNHLPYVSVTFVSPGVWDGHASALHNGSV